MKSWVKLYTEINRDADMGTLTWAQRGIWAALLALAGEIDDRDSDDNETGRLDTLDRVAWHLRCSDAELADCATALRERGMLAVDDDGVLRLANYGTRQGRKQSDTRERVRERVQSHRARNADAAPCNAHVTPLYRPVSRTDSDSDSDSDSEVDVEADARVTRAETPATTPPCDATVFQALSKAGRMVSSLEAERWTDLAAEYGADLIVECIGETARQAKQPSPAYVGAMAKRCREQGCLPGQWPNGKPRASPGSDALARADAEIAAWVESGKEAG